MMTGERDVLDWVCVWRIKPVVARGMVGLFVELWE